MTTKELRSATSYLEQTFRDWVRKGKREPAPSFEALRDISDYLPADVIEMLVTQRGAHVVLELRPSREAALGSILERGTR